MNKSGMVNYEIANVMKSHTGHKTVLFDINSEQRKLYCLATGISADQEDILLRTTTHTA